MMKIGIDAYCLYEKYNTGIGTLTLNIIKALSIIDTENKYVLFTPGIFHRNIASEILKNTNFKIVEHKGVWSKYRRLWLQCPGLLSKITKERIDIFWSSGEYIPVLLPKKITCVVSIHDVVFALYPETLKFIDKLSYMTLFRLCIKRANAIFTISNSSKREIENHIKPNKPLYVIYNGIFLEKYFSSKKWDKENYILFVGTIQPRKNLINVIKAFELLAQEVDYHLVVVGAPGWKNSEIYETLKNMNSDTVSRIKFLGYVDSDSLIDLYRKAKVFVSPSLHEGFGLIILEALASGTPVVTSNRGAIPEIFKDSVVYANPLSPEDIKSKIIEITKNKKKERKLIDYGIAYVKQYDITITAKNYLKTFEKLMR